MPSFQFTNLDFDEIKVQIKNFLRSNSNFTDFDFEGSNFSVLIDTLAYNTYINAFNANLVANESFLDSATVRENVVSLARNIGYVPRSKTSATAKIKLDDINLGTTNDNTPTIEGTAEAGSTVELFNGSDSLGTVSLLIMTPSQSNPLFL